MNRLLLCLLFALLSTYAKAQSATFGVILVPAKADTGRKPDVLKPGAKLLVFNELRLQLHKRLAYQLKQQVPNERTPTYPRPFTR